MIKFIRRIPCFFGKHGKIDKVQIMTEMSFYVKKLHYCTRCHRIIFIGYYPDYPNCLSQIMVEK